MLKTLFSVVVILCGMGMSLRADSVTLVPQNSQWSYVKGVQEASNPREAWRETHFDDSTWLKGIAPLYYGGGITEGTLLADMSGSYSSVYMRKPFLLEPGIYEKLVLKAFCDDGFILWINGTEVLRYNVPEGERAYNDLSTTYLNAIEWISYDLNSFSSILKPGELNTLAVHAFNTSLSGSSDFVMNLSLSADQTEDQIAPTLQSVFPASGSVIADPPSVVITFSEPVSGVSTNLLKSANGAALSVKELSSSRYLFEFAKQGSDGPLTLYWNSETPVRDLSAQAHLFIVPDSPLSYTVDTSLSAQGVIINEIMASNISGLRNRQGEYSDWIELYNAGPEVVDLSGWYLSDSDKDLTRWQFPEGFTLEAGAYQVLFCDNWMDAQPVGEYHTNFSLSKSGEYLALVGSDGKTVVHEFSPAFPKQYMDISYGCTEQTASTPVHEWAFYKTPTPGKANISDAYLDAVSEVIFSEPGGYKPGPFNLTLDTLTGGATIYYTLDGTVPTATSIRYTGPLAIDKISYLRAIAIKDGYIDSPVATRTWLFMDEVLSQSTSTPSGWPNSYSVNNHKLEYGMNSRIVRNNGIAIRRGMTNIQTLSLVSDLKNLFDPQKGVYVNPGNDGIGWERPVSIELIDPSGGDEFQIDAGLRIRGAYSRSSDNPKHSLRFFFRDEYGGKLQFPLFGEEGASEFDKVDLRTSQNFSWSFEHSPYNTFIRETFSRDSQRDFGMPYTRSRYYHLFINGQYWGLYQTQERSDSDYAETYFGGKSEDWDCIKTSQPGYFTEASDGNMNAFTDLYNIAVKQGFSGAYATNYYWIKGVDVEGDPIPGSPVYLDEDNLISYMLITYFARDPDCPVAVNSHANNLYGLYNRVNPTGFKWFKHDGEHSMAANRGYPVTTDLTSHGWQLNTLGNFNPMRLHQRLMDHPEYKMHWIDAVQKQMVNSEGALSLSNSLARWNQRQSEIDDAIVMESARWGHGYTRNDWITECNYTKNDFITPSADYLMKNLRSRGWFPSVDAPVFSNLQASEESVRLTLSGGLNVYYTTDGEDPRLPGGELNPFAIQLQSQAFNEKVLLEKGATWKYFDEGSAPSREGTVFWYQPAYTNSGWKEGSGRFGFGSRSVKTPISSHKAGTQEPLITAYFSTRFQVSLASLVPSLILDINADDGAVVYLNGTRVLLHNMATGHNYNSFATSEISGSDENVYQSYTIDPKYLVEGENLICVEVHQGSATSDDLYFDMQLLAAAGQSDTSVLGVITTEPGTLIKARSWDGNEWSAIAELDLTVWGEYSDLKVTEMMYAAALPEEASAQGWDRDDFAWIELMNTGKGVLDTKGVQFTSGITFTFPELKLFSGERLVLVKNLDAFSSQHDTNGMILLSGYSGNLSQKGETLSLQSPTGDNILTYTYSNKWYPQTDEGGYSLVVVDTGAEESLWSSAANWKAGTNLGGSPGAPDGTAGGIPAVIKTQPKNQWVTEGDSVLFSVLATGTIPMSYQWYKEEVPIMGATGTQLAIHSVQLSDAGNYSVQITNPAGVVTSRVAVLNVDIFVPVPPSIVSQPKSQNVLAGDSITFKLLATGTEPLRYEWYKNGILIEGETRNSFTLAEVTQADQGNTYYAVVSNDEGAATSEEVSFTVLDGTLLKKGDFIIAVDPDSSSYPAGENPPLAIDGDISTKYLNFGGDHSGFIVTPSCGVSIASAFKIATANDVEERDPASYEIYGTNETIQSKDCSPGTAESWTLIAAGQMELPSERFSESALISFENGDPYRSYRVIFPSLKNTSVGMMQLAEFQFYGVIWKEGAPTVSTVASHCVGEGKSVTFYGTGMGTMPLTYQWYKDGNPIVGATLPQFSIQECQLGDAGAYTLEVKNSLGSVMSEVATLQVKPLVVDPPVIEYLIEGEELILTFKGILYESDDLKTWTPVSGADAPTYRISLEKGTNRYFMSAIQ